MISIHRIGLSISNAFLVKGATNILIDTGSPGEGKKILKALQKHGLQLRDIALIVHTHGHSDHCGSTAELLQHYKVPTALHAKDLHMAQTGRNGKIYTTTLVSRLLVPFVDKPYAPFTPDHLLNDLTDLSSYGINANVIHTPGHSKGSLSIVFDQGDAIIGDLLMGGLLGGTFFPKQPGYHYFIEDSAALHPSIEKVLNTPAKRYWVGHGGQLDAKRVAKWYELAVNSER